VILARALDHFLPFLGGERFGCFACLLFVFGVVDPRRGVSFHLCKSGVVHHRTAVRADRRNDTPAARRGTPRAAFGGSDRESDGLQNCDDCRTRTA
jgi:hypothetical protein